MNSSVIVRKLCALGHHTYIHTLTPVVTKELHGITKILNGGDEMRLESATVCRHCGHYQSDPSYLQPF